MMEATLSNSIHTATPDSAQIPDYASQFVYPRPKNGAGKMTSLTAPGAQSSGFIESARSAEKNIVIDGCPVSCGKQIFEKLGLPFERHITTEMGVTKGKTDITAELVGRLAAEIEETIT